MKTILPGEIHFLTTRKRVQPAAFILNSSYKSRQVGLNFFLLPFHFFFACFQSLKTFLQFSIILPFLAFSFFIFPSLSFFPSFFLSFFLSISFSQFLSLILSLILSLNFFFSFLLSFFLSYVNQSCKFRDACKYLVVAAD